MPGRAVLGFVSSGGEAAIDEIPTYERGRFRHPTRPQQSDVDDEIRRQLESLGYLE
jgi:hypothetical protein